MTNFREGGEFGEGATMTHTNTEAVSDERLAEFAADACGVTPHSDMRPFVVQAVKYALSRRAANSAGGVEVKAELLVKQPTHGLPKAYGGCTCSCHRRPGVMHIVACCRPSDDDREPLMTREWFERKVVLEGDGAVSAGPLSSPAVEAEPVAWLEHAQRAYDILVSGESPFSGRECRASYALTYIPGLRLTHPSSPVSAEVTVTDEDVQLGLAWLNGSAGSADPARLKLAADKIIAALNGGRENG